MINLTPEQREDEQRRQDRFMKRVERKYHRQLRNEMNLVAIQANQGYNASGVDGTRIATQGHAGRLMTILSEMTEFVLMAMGTKIANSADKQKAATRPIEKKDIAGQIQSFITAYLASVTAVRVSLITATTQSIIQDVISKGQGAGLGQQEVAKNLLERLGGGFGSRRAMVIARTEVHGAAQAASQHTAELLGITLKKVWVSAEDERVRADHREANGQIQDLDETFNVGGESLRFPGDPNGSPSNVINCRCVQVYELV